MFFFSVSQLSWANPSSDFCFFRHFTARLRLQGSEIVFFSVSQLSRANPSSDFCFFHYFTARLRLQSSELNYYPCFTARLSFQSSEFNFFLYITAWQGNSFLKKSEEPLFFMWIKVILKFMHYIMAILYDVHKRTI